MDWLRGFTTVFTTEFLIIFRSRLDFFNPLLFFTLSVSLFPLTMGTLPTLLIQLAPGIVWIAVLFSAMLSFDHFFTSDYDDGSLEQLLLTSWPLPVLMLAKVLSQWIITCLPLILLVIPLGIMLYLPLHSVLILVITLMLGTPSLYFIGAVAAALTLGLQQKGFLIVLLVVPLYIPVLIFGTTAVMDAGSGTSCVMQLALLSAILSFCLFFAPFILASAVRITYD